MNPTVLKLGIVSFFADVASEMLYPITPLFLTTILGASMSSLGLIEGVAEGIASLLKSYSGVWSDRIRRRRPFIVAGYFLAIMTKPMIGLSTRWWHVLMARSLDRMGKGLRTAPRDALIADSVAPAMRGAAFGWHRAMDTLGAVVGPLLALYFLNHYGSNLRPLYFWALLPGLFCLLIVLSVKDVEPKSSQIVNENPFLLWGKFSQSYKNYIYAWGVFSLTNSSDVFLLLKAKSAGLSTQAVILLYCAYNLIYSLSSPLFGRWSDKMGRKKLMVWGLVVFSFVYVGFGFSKNVWQFFVLFLIYGLYMGATEGIGKALAIDLSPPHLRGTSVGVLGTVTGVCTIFASTMAGVLWDHVGASAAFFYGASGALVALVLLLKVDLRSSNECESIKTPSLSL